ncbi:DnaJ domain-containing protein [Hyphobacterium marinum]|uniref:DnaJ domain-containing protein n=1 Tax=Hyphobacterium marinum TaxID=3116574 RepID=A0ABU7LZ63_9PROT|nr:DnaJ domain-containing protein [Hyphobacterium sp. Y6023]MEE2566842.1 DnaJ domain-containing protein [Hyphobacterium sp. Y6023]
MLPLVLLGLAGLVVAMAVVGAMSRTNPKRAQRLSRMLLGVGACFVGAVMTLRGLAVLGTPIIGVGLVLLGLSARSPRAQAGAGGPQTPPRRSGTMTRREALEILGLEDGAGEADIREAYKSLMKKMHPDAGGSDALARQIQEARDTLLPKR